jgi:hypothetical protein
MRAGFMALGDGGERHQRIVDQVVEVGANVDLADGEGVTLLEHCTCQRLQGDRDHPPGCRSKLMKSKAAVTDESRFLREALELAGANIGRGGRPFGAVAHARDARLPAVSARRRAAQYLGWNCCTRRSAGLVVSQFEIRRP